MNDDQQALDPYTVINNLAEQIKAQSIQIAMLQAQNTLLQKKLTEGSTDE